MSFREYMERLSSAEASLNKAKPLHFSVTQDEILDLPRTGSRAPIQRPGSKKGLHVLPNTTGTSFRSKVSEWNAPPNYTAPSQIKKSERTDLFLHDPSLTKYGKIFSPPTKTSNENFGKKSEKKSIDQRNKKKAKQGKKSMANDDRFKFKTEECAHWAKDGKCKFGDRCLFIHGEVEVRSRVRSSKFRTETCSDPARNACGNCTYIKRNQNRCNFSHPGEEVRCEMGGDYFDEEYFTKMKKLYPSSEFPFGIYL